MAINFGSISNVSKEITKAACGELAGSPAIMSVLDGDFDDVATNYPEISVSALNNDPTAAPALLKFFGKAMLTPPPTSATSIADGAKHQVVAPGRNRPIWVTAVTAASTYNGGDGANGLNQTVRAHHCCANRQDRT